MQQENKYYNYILFDPRKPLVWKYKDTEFKYSPFYVGKGKNDRYLSHYKYFDGSNPYKENLIKILNNGGYIPIYVKLNENSSEEDALLNEIQIISYIKQNLGNDVLTNILDGGDQPPHYEGSKNPKARKIYQYDKDTGELLGEFECIREACRILELSEEGGSHIIECCKGKRRTFGTFKWSYEKLDKITSNKGKYDRIKFSKLIGYNEYESHEFNSMKEAYDFLGEKNKGKINSVLKGERQTYKGYYWKIEK